MKQKQGGKKVLHLMNWDRKFIPQFVSLMEESETGCTHNFVTYGDLSNFDTREFPNIRSCSSFWQLLFAASLSAARSDLVILHGLFGSRIILVLTLLYPLQLSRFYWAIWGGDLYGLDRTRSVGQFLKAGLRSFVIKRLGGLITHIKGDYELAVSKYRASGNWHDCFMYHSNVFRDRPPQSGSDSECIVLIGNSADPSNRHLELINILKTSNEKFDYIICPLSYGDMEYARRVAKSGSDIFGEKFISLANFMPLSEYQKILDGVDIAIFNHKRQQAMGNVINLLGFGKKVFMRKEVSTFDFFQSIGVKVFPIDELDFSKLTEVQRDSNIAKIREYFTEERLLNDWQKILA